MKRRILITLVAALGAAGVVSAQETNNLPIVLDWSVFKSIADKNIFDPSRSGRGGSRASTRPKQVVVRYFTFNGTMDDTAIFTGEGVPERGYVREGDLINGFKVMKITLHHVLLAEPAGTLITLDTDGSMRREDDGPWGKSDQPAPLVINATSSSHSSDRAKPAESSSDDSGETSASSSGENPQLVVPPKTSGVDPNTAGGDPASHKRHRSGGSTGSSSGSSSSDILQRLRQKHQQENQ